MGIYGAMSTAVTGLRAQSFALENISGNIANSQTTGFKRIDTDFMDLIPDAPQKRQTAGSVLAQSRSTNNLQGDVKAASVETYMAINGAGFFVVEPTIGQSDGNSLFSGANYYTRRGDFEVNKNGYLVNGAGYYLKGLPIDPETQNISGSVPQVLQISTAFLPAQQTTRIDYELNLPQLPQTLAYKDSQTAGSELFVPGDFANPDEITGAESEEFIRQTISGGAISIYSTSGAPANLQMRWAKVDSLTSGGADTWHLYYASDSQAAPTDTMWTRVIQDYTFGADGRPDPAIEHTDLTALTVNGVAVGNVRLNHGTRGLTQFADPNGTAEVALGQNGYPAGKFVSVAVNDAGRVVVSYDNGETVERAQVVTANFNAVNQLKRMDGGVFAATSDSGEPVFDNGGGISGSSLEASNTDISEEFTKLIVTQQAYAAGTRIVSTADSMLQEALNMLR